jgi:hypothetical protein
MKNLFALSLILSLIACNKSDDIGFGTLCFTNKTEVDFTGFSGLDVSGLRSNNFTKNKEQCLTAKVGTGNWVATLQNKDWTFASWEGQYNMEINQTVKINVDDSNKKFDFRDAITGAYNMTCKTSNINTSTFDTVQVAVDSMVAVQVSKNNNPFQLQVLAGIHYTGPVIFSEDPYYFKISTGGAGVFPPTADPFTFYTKTSISANADKLCVCSGKKL